MSAVESRDLNYSHEGINMIGRFMAPEMDDAPKPGILVVHGAHGLNDHIVSCARRMAALGYAVLAVDLWGEGRQLANPSEIGHMLGRFAADRAMWKGRLDAARSALADQPGVGPEQLGIVGYCFGGSSALEFVRTNGAVRAAVSFHGGLDLVADDWTGARRDARVLVCTGSDDPMATPEALARLQQAMSSAGMRWETDLYSHARHAFTETDRPGAPPFAAYDAIADRRSWASMQTFFDEIFGI